MHNCICYIHTSKPDTHTPGWLTVTTAGWGGRFPPWARRWAACSSCGMSRWNTGRWSPQWGTCGKSSGKSPQWYTSAIPVRFLDCLKTVVFHMIFIYIISSTCKNVAKQALAVYLVSLCFSNQEQSFSVGMYIPTYIDTHVPKLPCMSLLQTRCRNVRRTDPAGADRRFSAEKRGARTMWYGCLKPYRMAYVYLKCLDNSPVHPCRATIQQTTHSQRSYQTSLSEAHRYSTISLPPRRPRRPAAPNVMEVSPDSAQIQPSPDSVKVAQIR